MKKKERKQGRKGEGREIEGRGGGEKEGKKRRKED
jgi:hypothetical protein